MSEKLYQRKHASCPLCNGKPLITIQERSDRIPNVDYIRHVTCPYCGKKIELIMREYIGNEDQFQRAIHLRKIFSKDDNEFKKKQRIIEIHPQ